MSTNPLTSRPSRLAAGCLVATLPALLGACGASDDGTPAQGTGSEPVAADAGSAAAPQGASPGTSAPAPATTAAEPARLDGSKGYARGLETLETGYDLSSISSQAAPPDDGPPRVVADEGPPTGGLVRPGSRSKGSLSFAEGGPSFDLGIVRQGESRDHVFQLVSDGAEPVVIKAIKPSCGCTKAEILLVDGDGVSTPYRQGDPIDVGQHLTLFTRVSTEGKHGDFAATVSLYTNDPRGPFSVRVTAKIEPVLVQEPDQAVFFREMTTADRKESTVQVFSNRGEPFLLTVNEASLRAPLSAELEPVDPDADGRASRWLVNVILGPNAPIGMRNYPLVLDSDLEIGGAQEGDEDDDHEGHEGHEGHAHAAGDPKFYSTTIAVQARVLGLVHAEPGFVSFGMVRPGQVLERTVRLQCHDDFQLAPDMPVTIEGLYGQKFPYPDAFTTELVPVEGAAGESLVDLRLRLEGLPDEVNGSFGGILKLAVGHPSMEELSVRFSGVCRPGLAGG